MPTDCLTHIHFSAEVDYHLARLGVTCGQHLEPPAVVDLQTGTDATNQQISKFRWVRTDPVHWPIIPRPQRKKPAPHPVERFQSDTL